MFEFHNKYGSFLHKAQQAVILMETDLLLLQLSEVGIILLFIAIRQCNQPIRSVTT